MTSSHEKPRTPSTGHLRQESHQSAEVKKIKEAGFGQLKDILSDLREKELPRREIIEALMERVMVNRWVVKDSSVGITSWQHQYAQSDLYKLLDKALVPRLRDREESEKTYEHLVDIFATFIKQSAILSEYSQDLLKTILSGTSPHWLVQGAVRKLDHPDKLPGPQENHSESYHAYHRLLDWQKAYREVLFGENSKTYQSEFINTCDKLSRSLEGSGKAIQLLRESVFGMRTMHFYRKDGNEPEKKVVQQLIEEERGTYFFHIFACAVLNELERDEDPNSPHIRAETLLPFKVAGGRFGYFRDFGGERVLIISKPEETKDIAELLARHEQLQSALQKVYSARKEMADTYDSSNFDNWPVDVALEYQHITPAEEERDQLANQLRSYFLEKSSDKYYWGAPRPDKVLQLDTILGSGSASGVLELYARDVRDLIANKLGVRLEELTITEQMHFLNFANQVLPTEGKAIEKFAHKFGCDGLRTFLAASVDPKVGNEILEFGRIANNEKAQEVFSAFGKLADQIDKLESYLIQTFGSHNRDVVQALTERMLIRGRGLLGKAHTFRDNPEELAKLLENMNVETQLFTETCRVLKERGELKPEEIAGSEFAMVPGGSFKGNFRKTVGDMLRVQEERYGPSGADYKGQYPELFAALEASLKERIKDADKHSRFYLYQHEGKLVGFFRIDDVFEGGALVHKHLASVMGDPKYKGGKLIETLLQQTLEKERTVPIYAECDPTKPITQNYLSMGFVKKGERDELGLPIWDIELPAKPQA
ncbi:MAG: GNAT family N-acetyltransferase [Minisyncoccia bacterium]